MEQILQVIEQNRYVFIALGVAIVLSIVYSLSRMKKMKRSNESFLSLHPDAAKVYLASHAAITQEAVTVYSVNGAPPQLFSEGGKGGFYAAPGKNIVEVSYAYTRPGITAKNVTKTTDVLTQELLVEPSRSYLLAFDRKEEVFTFGNLA